MDQNTMFQNNFYNPGYMGGAMYGQPVKRAQMTNPLSPEERELLKVDTSFKLEVSPQDMARAKCTHRHPDKGEFAIVPNADGTVTCSICHTTFDPNIVNEQYVEETVNGMNNILETCKLLALDLNPEIITGYYQMIPFIKKAPQMFKLANQTFEKYNGNAAQVPYQNGMNYFGMMNMMTAPSVPMGGYGMPMQAPTPMYGYGMTPTQQMQMQSMPMGGSPFYAQQPMMTPPVQQPAGMTPPTYAAPQAPADAASTVTVKDSIQL